MLQDSNETLEEQKKWLVGRVLQQEMDSSELEQMIADLQAQLSERDSQIAALETEVCSSYDFLGMIHTTMYCVPCLNI